MTHRFGQSFSTGAVLFALVLAGCLDDAQVKPVDSSPGAAGDGEPVLLAAGDPDADARVKSVRSQEYEETFCAPMDGIPAKNDCLGSHIAVYDFACDPPQAELQALPDPEDVGEDAEAVTPSPADPDLDDRTPWVHCTYKYRMKGTGWTLVPKATVAIVLDEAGSKSPGSCGATGPILACGYGGGEKQRNITFFGPGETATIELAVRGSIHYLDQPLTAVSKHEHVLTVEIAT